MNTYTKGARVLGWTAVLAIAGLAVVGVNADVVDGGITDEPTSSVPSIDSGVVAQAEAAGLTCKAEPSLTDVVIVQDATTYETSVVTFDEALAGSEAGELFVRLYCTPA